MVGALLKKWPSLHIVGEEQVCPDTGDNVVEVDTSRVEEYLKARSATLPQHLYPQDAITVYVDPLDGTKEFTRGIYSHVTVLIGIAYNSEPIAGVVYQPWYCEGEQAARRPQKIEDSEARMYWGLVGYGVAGLEERHKHPARGIDELIATDSHSRPSPGLKILNPKKVINQGGCGSKSLLVVTGDADVYLVGTSTKKWDTCAPHALIKSLGGDVTDFTGKSIEYHRGVDLPNPVCIVAVHNHSEIVKILNK